MDKIDFYFDTLLNLREKYREYIDIKIGFEIEYYPKFWDKALEKYRQYPIEYLILGNHFLGNESIEALPISAPASDEAFLTRYVDECISAIKTGRITYLCHPDMINFTGDDEVYVKQMSRLILEANALDIPLEINLLGKRANRHYPRDLFWETAGKLGAKAIIGCDAHAPEHVGVKSEIENALRYADRFGIEILDDVILKNPIF
jgi:histidinol-phosphatase (PHP family)